jgi:DNA-binding NarL/FixJ family response regulator
VDQRAGARGYLVKGASQDDIARAIGTVASGGAVFGPGTARRSGPHDVRRARHRPALDMLRHLTNY